MEYNGTAVQQFRNCLVQRAFYLLQGTGCRGRRTALDKHQSKDSWEMRESEPIRQSDRIAVTDLESS
ncbi:hypothetical protein PAMP_016453 [Pampus punctatissimus]